MDKRPAKTTNQQAKNRQGFQPGQSGNPAGRREGSRNKVTLACERLLDGQAEAITQRAIDAALAGDMVALRLCLERLVPPRKDGPVRVALPAINTPADILQATSAVLAAVAEGELTPQEAQAVGALLEGFRRAIETMDHEERLKALEGRAPRRGTT